MLITRLRGNVAQEHWTHLQQQYERLVHSLPDGLAETYLVQSQDQPAAWEILTIWQSEEAYESVRAQKKTEACEQLFLAVESVPDRQTYRVRRGHQRV